MNLFSTAIYEIDEGEILILWGGRRIVTTCLVPPLVNDPEMEQEHVWKRRYRYDSGNLILTRIYDNYSKREDYNTNLFGRNPAIIKDFYGRIIIAYRIPIISSQDPTGALSEYYVNPKNAGTTAGMNFWKVYNSYDFSQFSTNKNFDWQEQVDIPVDYLNLKFKEQYENLSELYEELKNLDTGLILPIGEELVLFTDITMHPITGEIWIRGMGGNLIDTKEIKRWKWNENEGLGRTFTSAIIDSCGRQVRLYGNQILASRSDKWEDVSVIWQTRGNYGISGAIRENRYGKYCVCGYSELNKSIPWQFEDETGIQTEKMSLKMDNEYEEMWDDYNEKEKVIENANIPDETYFSYEDKPTDEQIEKTKKTLAYYYYDLPSKEKQRVGFWISKYTGLIFISWMHGNLTFIEKEDGKYIAVGLRIAVSYDNGRHFEPLLPERTNFFKEG